MANRILNLNHGIISFSLSLLFSKYNPLLCRCWIQTRHVWPRMLLYYGPLVVLWCFNIVLYVALLYKFHLSKNTANEQSHKKAKRYAIFFCIVFIFFSYFRYKEDFIFLSRIHRV